MKNASKKGVTKGKASAKKEVKNVDGKTTSTAQTRTSIANKPAAVNTAPSDVVGEKRPRDSTDSDSDSGTSATVARKVSLRSKGVAKFVGKAVWTFGCALVTPFRYAYHALAPLLPSMATADMWNPATACADCIVNKDELLQQKKGPCTITQEKLEKNNVGLAGKCPGCRHLFGAHPSASTEISRERKVAEAGNAVKDGFKNNAYTPEATYAIRQAFYGREAVLKKALEYVNGAHTMQESFVQDKKFHLLGTSGMKGIGKSELLKHIAWEVKRLKIKGGISMGSYYITFNGGGCGCDVFNEARQHGVGVADAFGQMLLNSCGVEKRHYSLLPFDTALSLLRFGLGVEERAPLVICVDEVGELGDKTQSTLSALMSRMDCYNGQLIFIFAHILQSTFDRGSTGSGRPVIGLELPPLEIDIWAHDELLQQKCHLKNEASHPAIHQLLLQCSGHPRAVFDGIPAALADNPSLLTDPTEEAIINACAKIIKTCKFNDLSEKRIGDVVNQWFDIATDDAADRDSLVYDGLLHTFQGVGAEATHEFLFPLLVKHWAKKKCTSSKIAYHLQQFFAADAVVGHDAEKRMEAIMYHYEAVLRLALAGKKTTLRGFYRSTHIAEDFVDMTVTAPCAAEQIQVREVTNFDDVHKVIDLLEQGYIVVSKRHSELGVEYFAPFTDTKTNKLVVAAVQCKFVTDQTPWGQIKHKMAKATALLKKKGVHYFPVVYTTVDQKSVRHDTLKDGVYFIEHDLFRFTSRLGILRLHTQKLGDQLRQQYPLLSRARSSLPESEK